MFGMKKYMKLTMIILYQRMSTCLYQTLQYLCYDFECDKDGGFAHYYGLNVQDVKPKVLEMLKFCNCENNEHFSILLNAFDAVLSNEKWKCFYRTVDELFTIWYIKHTKNKKKSFSLYNKI